ncbi:MAG: CvpA family protein, partial [Gemmatimonadetes bacterium]|nr:CvpA family protein [Gemmatimonadota bacterium]
LFLLSLVILTVFAHMASSRVKGTMLGPLDNALGFVFGLVRGALVVSLLYLIATLAWDEDDMPGEIAEARTLPMIVFGADVLAS